MEKIGNKFILGITGGVGSGKSRILDILQKDYGFHVIQADETPVLVNKDGRAAGSKSFMLVYRSGYMYSDMQIVLYEYQRTRNASHPRQFQRLPRKKAFHTW